MRIGTIGLPEGAALAPMAGVTDATISAWEHGRSPANWDNLCAVLPELEEYRP